MTTVQYITTPSIRLDDFLKWIGWESTGGQAKCHIQQGGYCVNGQICTQRGKKLVPGDKVRAVDGDREYVIAAQE